MITVDLKGRAERGIRRYQASEVRRRNLGCCRFHETCSHYALRALREHSGPVALLLVCGRLLRCNPLLATRRDRRRSFAVLALSVITTALVCWTSAAAAAPLPPAGSPTIAGGCRALVGGHPLNDLTASNPLEVHPRQGVFIEGQAPPNVAGVNGPEGLISTKIHLVGNLATRTTSDDTNGLTFRQAVNVDTYLKYGSGVYQVDVHSFALKEWECRGTFYVKLNGDKKAAMAAIAVGGIGVVGVTLSARGDEPTTEDMANSISTSDGTMNRALSGGYGCLIVVLAMCLAAFGFGSLFAVPAVGGGNKRVWVRGHPVAGFFSGLLAGVGIAIACQQYGLFTFTITTAIVYPLVAAVLGALRGWRGKAYKVVPA